MSYNLEENKDISEIERIKTIGGQRSGKTAQSLNDFIKGIYEQIFMRKPTQEDMNEVITRELRNGFEIYTKDSPYKIAVIKRQNMAFSATIHRHIIQNEDQTYSVVSTIPDRAKIKKLNTHI